ncbi:MAG: hypothetical protein ABEH43_04215, partial [Flavobacteriales bacterium]
MNISIFKYYIPVFALLFVFISNVRCQEDEKPKNLPQFEKRGYHFGFTLGINTADFYMNQSDDRNFEDSLLTLKNKERP